MITEKPVWIDGEEWVSCLLPECPVCDTTVPKYDKGPIAIGVLVRQFIDHLLRIRSNREQIEEDE